jgi:hypothetical protein
MSSEEELLSHMRHHRVKQWLLDGCEREDARTIMAAVEAIPERRLIRRLARALTKDSSW